MITISIAALLILCLLVLGICVVCYLIGYEKGYAIGSSIQREVAQNNYKLFREWGRERND